MKRRRKNRTKSRVRAKVEWPFRILKRVFGFTRVRYRGLKKNHEWLPAAFALVNLYQHRKRVHRKQLRLRTINRNLCPFRLTHSGDTPLAIKAAPILPFETSSSTVQLPERG